MFDCVAKKVRNKHTFDSKYCFLSISDRSSIKFTKNTVEKLIFIVDFKTLVKQLFNRIVKFTGLCTFFKNNFNYAKKLFNYAKIINFIKSSYFKCFAFN